MARTVKNGNLTARRTIAQTRISSKHQVTIAKHPFEEAGFRAGDVVAVRSVGPGRVELTSLDALFARHRGRLATGGTFRRAVEGLRDEWE